MRSAIRAVSWFLAGVLAFVVLAEAALHVLPSMRGLQTTADAGEGLLRHYEPNRPYRYSYSWAMLNAHTGRTNNYGQIAPRDFTPMSRPMVVIGDSFVESLMNDYDETLQGVLGRQLAERPAVYGLGISALSISDYVALARQARDEFAPVAAVFVIVDGDVSESLRPRPGGFHLQPGADGLSLAFTPRTPNPWVQWLRNHVGESALYSYVRGNLKFSPTDLLEALHHGRQDRSALPAGPSVLAQEAVVDWFLRELPAATGVPPSCSILLFDADRDAIYGSRRPANSKDNAGVRRRLVDLAQAAGFQTVDLGPAFRAAYAKEPLKLDHSPIDRHWNARGHAVAAEAVLRAWRDQDMAARCAGQPTPRPVGKSA